MEPGRFLVAECGIYLTQVLYRKQGYQKEFLIVDGGMNQHYSAAGGIGQVIRRNYEIDVVSQPANGENSCKFTVAGNLCLPADILANDLELTPAVGEGDILAFFNSGAYGYSASPLNFLSHDLPAEMLI